MAQEKIQMNRVETVGVAPKGGTALFVEAIVMVGTENRV
jgi:hypothetical protein